MSRWCTILLNIVLLQVAYGQRNSSLSGCEICATTGDCSQAFRAKSGQFCGHWLDRRSKRRPCCCPDDAVCRVSNYACFYSFSSHDDGHFWLWCLLGSIGLFLGSMGLILCIDLIAIKCDCVNGEDECSGGNYQGGFGVGGNYGSNCGGGNVITGDF
ncbi:uncharacterized protein PHALS_08925 [Plasmopara halstedii]|uniref:RxLR-like protein n=1 Tax=Plasmopara halstedii TaxID=4781 RepID=A0A0P1AE23_PLAHL|nr:uncharacterized protein PHALS_08925 [Plasmopara halstedii]CEG38878.1 hypothetical protein PHALS_08925 [Plasmopara halstedii]|eukprot:XP_024575247.1 hypothetical protein PHALS_08925 [Plasmopara halstedii]